MLQDYEKNQRCAICLGNLVIKWKDNNRVLCCANNFDHDFYDHKSRIPDNLKTEVAKGMTTALTKMSPKEMLKRVQSVKWPKDMTPALMQLLSDTAIERGLDPLEGELMIYQGKPYVGVNGRRRKAQETGELDGVHKRPGTPDEKIARGLEPEDYLSFVEVWRKGSSHSYEGWGVVHKWEIEKMMEICKEKGTDPYSLPIVKDPQNMSDKRGVAAALKEGFHLPLPSAEDIVGGPERAVRFDAESTARILDDDAPQCPVHHKPFTKGEYGWYCKTKVEGGWCKEKPQEKTGTEPPAEEGVFTETDTASSAPTEAPKTEAAKTPKAAETTKKGPPTKSPIPVKDWAKLEDIKSFGNLYTACYKQWPEYYSARESVLAMAGCVNQEECVMTPKEIYETILALRKQDAGV
jgi:hypothetical protein